MIDQLETRCCGDAADMDRLLCRLSAHDSYGASAAFEHCAREAYDEDGEP